ncbi:ethylene-responsive transcription factor ERF011-like [Impatiens glandulifera]|uniref:ethylene-responsive transcription factor ERF011-like n=1 Tax=Impatiens glandulifera TaxID=253017 RepID=UPI001FB19B45|nr:ethylene-responsive transcription factor ERF011-like [Impatiens glandulifera]
MEGDCCSPEKTKLKQQQQHDNSTISNKNKPYRGIRMRKWGKWVAEIREPNKRSRIWLGSYSSPIAAARAYDTAVFYLRGPTARLNFPEFIAAAATAGHDEIRDMSAASIRKRATEVGARVDAMETAHQAGVAAAAGHPSSSCDSINRRRVKPDLNEYPDPESSEEDES